MNPKDKHRDDESFGLTEQMGRKQDETIQEESDAAKTKKLHLRKQHIIRMDAYSRHLKYLKDYYIAEGKPLPTFNQKMKTDFDVLKETYRFIRNEEDDALDTWETRLAQTYYKKLFREYCIVDLSGYKTRKIGMRWRTEGEVIEGKGQFVCGEKKCSRMHDLTSYEVPFRYEEDGKVKDALVKVRLCDKCALKMWPNLKSQLKERRRQRRKERKRIKEQSLDNEKLNNSEDEETSDEKRRLAEGKGDKDHALSKEKRKRAREDEEDEEDDAYSEKSKRSKVVSTENELSDFDSNSETHKERYQVEDKNDREEEEEEEEEEKIKDEEKRIWSAPVEKIHTREDDFSSYFEGMFL
ncbi:putative Folate-sensitive fragile site protein [Monocercomonoides exilis]|uniref:putative Folate-sensitive fragile site protein n=1 Tax=Monocercomonoides exilis TaxID=2049356 RepID=UPI00355A704E|nr:putative Folate-sensitive fragile site protein [Monocercomonoides exilis]